MPRLHLAPLLLTAACVGGGADSTVVILHNQAVTGTSCDVSAAGDTFLSTGLLHTQSPVGYVFTPVVENFSDPNTDAEQSRYAFLEGARINIHFADPGQEDTLVGTPLTRFEVPLSGAISPGGRVGLGFEIVPNELLAELAAADVLLVDVKLFGSIGGSDFETANFRYPVEICDDCLVALVGDCAALPVDYAPTLTGNPCNPYQDAAVECCTSGTTLVCPAASTL